MFTSEGHMYVNPHDQGRRSANPTARKKGLGLERASTSAVLQLQFSDPGAVHRNPRIYQCITSYIELCQPLLLQPRFESLCDQGVKYRYLVNGDEI